MPPPKKLNAKKANAVGIVDRTNQDGSVENEDELTTGDKQGSLDDNEGPNFNDNARPLGLRDRRRRRFRNGEGPRCAIL